MKKYESELMKSLHEEAKYFHSKGIINADEMKEYDEGCLAESASQKADASASSVGGLSPLAASGASPQGRSVR
jgi:hypothetical protein